MDTSGSVRFFGFSLTPQDLGLEVCKVFQQQSYYYQLVPINNWQVTFFRAYPHPWELLGRKILQIYMKIYENHEATKVFHELGMGPL